ncbi:MAG: extracellular solute-binding protein [Chloroflexi bacterium]|nr:MAG: extracellular solute-binding protein [Chloroflexota bacterium]
MTQREKSFRIAIRKFGPFESAIEKQWASFQQKTGITLSLETEALDLHPLYHSYFEKEDLKQGNWDVGFLSSDWFATAHQTGAVLNIAPYLADNPPEDYPHGWTSSLLHMHQFDDVVLGLPYHDGPECLIYRKDLFEDPQEQEAYQQMYGTPLRVPQSWDEFHRVARFFHRPEQGLYGTVFAAYPDGHNTVYDFCLQLWTRGGELFDSSGQMMLNTPQAAAALEFYRRILNDPEAIHPQAREFDSVKSGFAFANGEVAMMINWFGFAAMAETIAESQVKGKVDIATIPFEENGRTVSLNAYWILCIAAGTPHPDIAYEFIRHCASAPMDKLLTLEGGIGCRKSTWADGDVNQTIPFYHKMESLHHYARELPRLPHWAKLAGFIDELVLAVINTDRPIPELLQTVQEKIRR